MLKSARSKVELVQEIGSAGHQNWDPMQKPWQLLLEIENNILIRPAQISIAQHMIAPPSKKNAVMQLSMGEGKSSVIVPLVAHELADQTRLVRIIILRPLLNQMLELLIKRLGGLLNRQVVHMPFSRSLRLTKRLGEDIQRMYQDCMETGSILVIQPEHVLSFELMGLEHIISGQQELGTTLVETQQWLNKNSRDILDESDEILNVQREPIYTIGVHRSIDFSPERWTIVQHVLRIVGIKAPAILKRFPRGLEHDQNIPGSLSRLRILSNEAGDALLKSVAIVICEEGLPGAPLWTLPEEAREALACYLTSSHKDLLALDLLQETIPWPASMVKTLLMLKGLLGCGVLTFILSQKRWRVNFGLDPSRTQLAVPYRAKDVPAGRAEFGHPDVTIGLTCLCYYYGGLSEPQIRLCFENLCQSDNAQEHFELWLNDVHALPTVFRNVSNINLKNNEQCSKDIFPHFKFAIGIINYFLPSFVFPAEVREFSYKLSSSGWNIAQVKTLPTTGFSGTNDSSYLLPLTINQCDLDEQLPTNAEVLQTILRSENSVAQGFNSADIKILNAKAILELSLSLEPEVRVIIDVGAQVLEWSNEELASTWLSKVPENKAQAAIFFDAQGEICVLSRNGQKQSFKSSSFATQIDQCLVYLDESHTRGTDLKLPLDYRALVTLGPGLTKDRLVQGWFTRFTLQFTDVDLQHACGCGNLVKGNQSCSVPPPRCRRES